MWSSRSWAGRAVRTYAPRRTATLSSYSPSQLVAAAAEQPSTAAASQHRARHLTESLLRSHAPSKLSIQTAPLASIKSTSSSVCAASTVAATDTSPPEMTAVRTVAQLALSFGKSAFLTHVAHQDDDPVTRRPRSVPADHWELLKSHGLGTDGAACGSLATPTRMTSPAVHGGTPPVSSDVTALRTGVDLKWDELTEEAKGRWVCSTPQGRRAFDHATRLLHFGGGGPGHQAVGEKNTSISGGGIINDAEDGVPSMESMLSKYDDALVQTRRPQIGTLGVPSKPRGALLRQLRVDPDAPRQSGIAAAFASHGMMHTAYENNANCRHLRDRADAARGEEYGKVWQQTLSQLLGGEAATLFARDIKNLQQPYEEVGDGAVAGREVADPRVRPSGDPAETAMARERRDEGSADVATRHDVSASFPEGLLNLCDELRIRSPRRAYVLFHVLQEVDTAAGTGHPLSLTEVQTLALALSSRYDALRQEAQRAALEAGSGNVSSAEATRRFELAHLSQAAARVQAKLEGFQADLPLLKTCVNAVSR